MASPRALALVLVPVWMLGCSDWTPIKNARDVEGQRVRIEADGQRIVIDEVVVCDTPGYVIAKQDVDCQEGRPLTFDTRRDKVSVYSGDGKANAGLVVAGVLAAILIPAAIGASIYFGSAL
jgi:hypothetical protein